VRGVFGSYRKLCRTGHGGTATGNLVYYLVASAVFRDGLAGVFTFGCVARRQCCTGFTGHVLIFGVAASVVAAVGAVFGGFLDDRVGPSPSSSDHWPASSRRGWP